MQKMEWGEIVALLPTLELIRGGNIHAQRGFVTYADGTKFFIKIGTDDYTKRCAKKEIVAYDFLAKNTYPYAPHLFASNED